MTRSILGVLAFAAALVPWQSTNMELKFADRTGPYLGDKPPGLTPEVFAPALVSTGGFERDVAITPDDRWSDPINLGPAVNTSGSQEFSPYVSPDGKYFFFMSSKLARPDRLTFQLLRGLQDQPGNGNADIYWVDASLVTRLRSKAVFAAPPARPTAVSPSHADRDRTSARGAGASGTTTRKELR